MNKQIAFLLWALSLIVAAVIYSTGWILESELNKLYKETPDSIDYEKLSRVALYSLIVLCVFTFICLVAMSFYIYKKSKDKRPISASTVFAYFMLVVVGSIGIAFYSILIRILKDETEEKEKHEKLQNMSEHSLGISSLFVGVLLGIAFGYFAFRRSSDQTDDFIDITPVPIANAIDSASRGLQRAGQRVSQNVDLAGQRYEKLKEALQTPLAPTPQI